jgi:hypothetical protein
MSYPPRPSVYDSIPLNLSRQSPTNQNQWWHQSNSNPSIASHSMSGHPLPPPPHPSSASSSLSVSEPPLNNLMYWNANPSANVAAGSASHMNRNLPPPQSNPSIYSGYPTTGGVMPMYSMPPSNPLSVPSLTPPLANNPLYSGYPYVSTPPMSSSSSSSHMPPNEIALEPLESVGSNHDLKGVIDSFDKLRMDDPNKAYLSGMMYMPQQQSFHRYNDPSFQQQQQQRQQPPRRKPPSQDYQSYYQHQGNLPQRQQQLLEQSQQQNQSYNSSQSNQQLQQQQQQHHHQRQQEEEEEFNQDEHSIHHFST